VTDDDAHTPRWERVTTVDPRRALRDAIAEVRTRPRDDEARRRLRAVASEHNAWDQLAALLASEARAAEGQSELAAAFWTELADVHEWLDQGFEEIAALEMVATHTPHAIDAYDRLARLYRREGAWAKAAEAFVHVASLADDDRARAALRSAGRLYREHGELELAAEVYRVLVERKPGDHEGWRTLESVLSQLERWRELADVRAELADRADNPIDKAVLLRSQARALEQLGDTAGAAELVALAACHAPDHVSSLVDYATVLARDGKGDEAAELLRARVAEARSGGAGGDELAALQLRLVLILDETCDDQAQADVVLDELLAEAPSYTPALERLVARAAQRGDLRAHADALVRHARVNADAREQATELTEAARHYRDAGQLQNCVRALDAALDAAPDDTALVDELADAKSALAVEQALADERDGRTNQAIDRLKSLLARRALDIPANLAFADTLERAQRGDEAAEHLRMTLAAAPEDTPPQRLAPLVFRLARTMQTQGDDDEAHRLLHEAHRLDRRALAITLALGESCFRRRLWREAAIHLGSLAEHPDAPARAAEVARGLIQAARAEVRALRPGNAPKHYEAAVRIDPGCAPAWHALGEAAHERGDHARAVECFEREVLGTSDPRERARLADSLGEQARTAGDLARAERVWASALVGADRPLVTKLLALQRARGAGRERGETCVRLATLTDDVDNKHELLEEATLAFSEAGDPEQARALAEELIAARPLAISAVTCATGVAIAAGDLSRAAQWLRRALTAWDASGNRGDDDPRRAELWRRLGDCERAAGNLGAAVTAYERAIAASPESDGALSARRGLVTLAPRSRRPTGELLAPLVEADPAPSDVVAYARELDAEGYRDEATAMLELAYALDRSLLEDDERERATNAVSLASDVAYGTKLSDADRRELIDDPGEAPLDDLLQLVAEALPLLCPDARTALDRAGHNDAVRLGAQSQAAAAATFPQIAKALGGAVALLYASERADTELRVVLASPPIIVLGPRLLAMRARSHTDGDPFDVELRFRLGRAIELARPPRVLAVGNGEAGLTHLLAALPHACGRGEPPDEPELQRASDSLRSALPAQLRRRIADKLAPARNVPGSPGPPLGAATYLAACQRAADRAGLLACGHIAIGIDLAGGLGAARHLVALAASRRYLAVRRALRPRRA
jgi:tetratricopeptide (TPR) repeat protein